MWGIAAAIAAVAGLLGLAATRRSRQEYLDRRELAYLSALLETQDLTLDQAEDGLVLSRKSGNVVLERRFRSVVTYIKQHHHRR